MKKRRIIIAASVPLVAFAVCAYLYNEHPLTLKLLNGSSRVLSPVQTTIKMDGQVQTTAKCFAMKTLFDGEATDSLVIWLPNASSHYGREILMNGCDIRSACVKCCYEDSRIRIAGGNCKSLRRCRAKDGGFG
jgi:hypothetical protein